MRDRICEGVYLLSCTYYREGSLLVQKSSHREGPNIMASNRIVHFEIPANNPVQLTQCYSELFGWKFQKAPIPGPEYWLCDTGSEGPGINGAVMQRQNAQQPLMNYVDVPDIDAAIGKATKLGAKVAMPKMPIPGVGAVAA